MFRGEMRYLVAGLIAALALLFAAADASANFVYWTNAGPSSSIGRVKINGTGLNNSFVPGLSDPRGIAVDSKYIYWAQGGATTGSIGRANLDGTAPNPNFIPHSAGVNDPFAVAVTPTAIYWTNGTGTIGRADISGANPTPNFITMPSNSCGLAADSSFLYFINASANRIGRASQNGGSIDPSFISVPGPSSIYCGLAVDASFVYYASDSGNTVGRAPVGGGAASAGFIPAGTTGGGPVGVTVNPQYAFWGDDRAGTIGRANIDGSSPSDALVSGAAISGPNASPSTDPSQFAAAPANKITVDSITNKKKKGTAAINARVPGPGQVTLDQTSTPPDTNAVAAAVKQQGLTITSASSFTLAVKPVGKTAKKLKKQAKKKGKGKVKQTVFIHFVPSGVAGVPNDQAVTVTLIKRGKRRK